MWSTSSSNRVNSLFAIGTPVKMNTEDRNVPVNRIDAYGLDVCAVFDRSSGTLTVTDNQTGKTTTAPNVFSGNGDNVNKPAAQHIVDKGPLPAGKYLIGNAYPHTGSPGDNQWYRLYGENGSGGYSYASFPVATPSGGTVNRGRFNLHTGGASDGCVTVRSDVGFNDPSYPTSKAYDKIKEILDATEPYKYNNSTYRGFLTVQ